MAEPKKKLSKTRTNRRRADYKIPVTAMIICKNCGKPSRPHFVCGSCGFYKGRSVRADKPTNRIVLDSKDSSKK